MMNTSAIFGTPERARKLQEMTVIIALKNYMPGIINQLGIASLLNSAAMARNEEASKPAEDDDVPELVENFEEVSKDE